MKSGVTLTLAWTDGTEMDYTHWCGDEYNSSDKCVRMKRYCDYRWSDRTCKRQYTYVCRVGMYTAFSVCFNKETFINYKLGGGGGYKMKKKTCIQNSLLRQGKNGHAPPPLPSPRVFCKGWKHFVHPYIMDMANTRTNIFNIKVCLRTGNLNIRGYKRNFIITLGNL